MTVSELRTLVDNLDEYIHIPGGIDRLKKMVLHLAITGQLVPQDPSEGTGEQLYEIIQAKKAELVKQGKIKKQKAVADVDHDELPFIIPTSWKWARLGDILSKVTDGSHNPPKGTIEGLPMLSSRNVTEKGLDFKNVRLLSDLDFANENKRTDIQEDDVLLTIVGSIGRTLVVNKGHGKFTLQRSVAVLTPIACDPYYVSSVFIQSPFMQETLDNEATGTAQRGIYLNQIKMLHIPLPPFAEQKRIVAKVDSIFSLIDHLAEVYKTEQAERSKLVASLLAQLAKAENDGEDSLALTHLSEIIRTKADAKILRQTILHLAVSGQLVPQDPSEGTGEELYQQIQAEKAELVKQGKTKKQKPMPAISDDEIPFFIPASWKWARLAEVTVFTIGRTPSRSESKYWSSDYMPWVSIADLRANSHINTTKERISQEAYEKCFRGMAVPAGSLLYSFKLTIGKMSIIDMDAVHNEAIASFATTSPVFTEYLFKALEAIDPTARTNSAVMGKTLNSSSLSLLEIPLPPLPEQERIVTKTTQLLNLITELEEHLVG